MQGYNLDIQHIPEKKTQQTFYPDSCESIHPEGRVKIVKSMNNGSMDSEYQ